jgi:hypothetical protein
MSLYGTPHYRIEQDVTDRIGIRTLVLSRLWQATRWPLTDPELQAEKPEIPAVAGGMLLVGAETRPAGGGLRTYWSFEGIAGDGKSVTFKDRSNSLDYGFQAGLEQTDIRKFPKIQELIDRYGGVVDPSSLEIIWPLTIGGAGGSASGLGGGTRREERNPMFGRNEFLQATGTYTFRYASLTLPSGSGVGKIHKSGLPGRAPIYAGRDWYQAPSPYVRRGVIFDITDLFLLSGEGGWPEPIYALTSGGGGGSVSSGSFFGQTSLVSL